MNELITLLTGPGGLLVALLVIIFTGMRRMWVFGWQYADCVIEKNEWKEAALRGTRIAERAVTVHESHEKFSQEER